MIWWLVQWTLVIVNAWIVNNLSLVNIFGKTGRLFYNINYMLNSKHLSLVNKIGDKTEFTITRVHYNWEKNIWILAGNLNSNHSYLITAAHIHCLWTSNFEFYSYFYENVNYFTETFRYVPQWYQLNNIKSSVSNIIDFEKAGQTKESFCTLIFMVHR